MQEINPHHLKLKPKALTLLRLLAEGLPAKVIAEKLGQATKTVSNNLSQLYHQLGVDNSKAAVSYFSRHRKVLEAGINAPAAPGAWYLSRLMDQDCKIASERWWATPEAQRPAEARLTVCLMLALQDDPSRAKAEAKRLIGLEANLFYLWQQWYSGHHNSWAELNQLALQVSFETRTAVYLAACHGACRRGWPELAHQLSYRMLYESLQPHYVSL